MEDGSSVAIFWDIENCAPPRNMKGTSVKNVLVREVQKFGPIKQISAYAELANFPSALRIELQRSGVHLIDTPKTRKEKDVADHMIITDMYVYAMENAAPQTIVLVSGDIDYAYSIAKLKLRGYRIVLILPPVGAHPILKEQADVIFEWAEMMKTERESSESELAITVMRYEPLISALEDLSREGLPRVTSEQIGIQLNSKYPDWPNTSGFAEVSEYVNDAAQNGWVSLQTVDSDDYVFTVEEEEHEVEEVDPETDRFSPLLTVLQQLSKPEPELAQIGIMLRLLMKNPLEQLGVSQLLEYIQEAERAGIVAIRRDGLQYYVSKAGTTEQPDSVTEEDEDILETLEAALKSLREDEMVPTGKAVIGRMRELRPGWDLYKSSMKDIPNLLSKAKEHLGVIVERDSSNYLVFPPEGKYEFIDPREPDNDLFTENHWKALRKFLMKNPEIVAKGRYRFAMRLKKEAIPGLKKLSLGKLSMLVQLAVNRGWLVFNWSRLSISRALTS